MRQFLEKRIRVRERIITKTTYALTAACTSTEQYDSMPTTNWAEKHVGEMVP